MSRLDVRCNVDLPVTVLIDENGKGIDEMRSRFKSLSLSGGLIDFLPYHPRKRIVCLKYNLPRHGEFEIFGEVLRKEDNGVATKFYNLNRDTKLRLWDYLKEHLPDYTTCPYCCYKIVRKVKRCNRCGWSLNFDSPDYIIEHEKETFIKRLAMKSQFFSIEDIYKTLNFVDVEILGIGKNLEINEDFVGSCNEMLDVFSMIRRTATTDIPLLIIGERGTGKELTARAIHERSQRRDKPFVPINCAAIPEEPLEKELFGCEIGEGEYKAGKLEYADGGTLFLDEVESLTPRLQSRLLRFLEDRVVERPRAKGRKKIDVRLVAASNTHLKSAAAKGRFRKDLLKRLSLSVINLPPVRDRGEDKIILARYFLNKFSKEMNLSKTFSAEAVNAIKSYNWPGNVREIINRVKRAMVITTNTMITPGDLDLDIQAMDMGSIVSLRDVRDRIEKQKLIEALSKCNNNISKVARALGISRPSVYSLKRKYNI